MALDDGNMGKGCNCGQPYAHLLFNISLFLLPFAHIGLQLQYDVSISSVQNGVCKTYQSHPVYDLATVISFAATWMTTVAIQSALNHILEDLSAGAQSHSLQNETTRIG